MAKYNTYRIRKPDGEYHAEPVRVRSTVPVEVHLSNVEDTIFGQYKEMGDVRPLGRWELVKETA